MTHKLLFALIPFLWLGCSDDAFQQCKSISIEEMRKIPAESATAKSCYTLYGDLAYEYDQMLCQRKPCFFMYEVDAKGARLKNFIYLSDSLKAGVFPNWSTPSKHELTRVTGYYYPNRIPKDTPLDPDGQEAFFVVDVE